MDIEYKVIRSMRKTLALSLDGEGVVIVRAPLLCSPKTIDKFVRDSAPWIERQRRRAARIERTANEDGPLTKEDIAALSREMKKALPAKLARYSALLGVRYSRVSVRCQRTKWGSCSAKGGLNFNCLLMLAPEEVLDYVVVHELCHLKHMDHSKEFWDMVASAVPDHKAHRKWLRENGPAIMKRAERER